MTENAFARDAGGTMKFAVIFLISLAGCTSTPNVPGNVQPTPLDVSAVRAEASTIKTTLSIQEIIDHLCASQGKKAVPKDDSPGPQTARCIGTDGKVENLSIK
jgi:hypothetical protein